MAKFEDYLPGGKNNPNKQEGLDEEITDASDRQEEREAATPSDIDWENRYKELERLNSRQAQELGQRRKEVEEYRTAFDEYLLNGSPTPADEEATAPEPITSDDLFEHPDEAINKVVENHPAIREARENSERARKQAILDAKAAFEERHPKYQETMSDPAFANWVQENSTRLTLAQRADQWDFDAADALFSLYEAEQALNNTRQQVDSDRAFEQAALENAGVGEPPPEAKYSRAEMREKMIASKRGDEQAARYLQTHLPKYRAALAAGEVTD